MLNGKSGTKDKVHLVQLSGAVDEDANFDSAVGAVPLPPIELHVNLGQITKINSIGIKLWVGFFEKATSKGTKLFFWDCPPHVVQQINLVQNFTCGGKVMSLQLPFACDSCNNGFNQTVPVTEAAKMVVGGVPDQKCPKCGKTAPFDEMTELYFRFLSA